MIRTVYGRTKIGTALIPLKDALNTVFVFSTRVGDAVVDKGNGTSPISYSTGKMLDFTTVSRDGKGVNLTYSSAFTGNASVKFLKGLKDVYSWASTTDNVSGSRYNITDIETFFSQFPNLYSVCIDEYVYQTSANMAIIKGDLVRFPDSVEKVLLNSLEILNVNTDLVLNFSNYNNTSKLKSFSITTSFGSYAPKILGDLGKLPSGCNYLNIQKFAAGSAITYTAGKVWASAFDTLYLPPILNGLQAGSIVIDLKNSVTSAIGGKIINISGWTYKSVSSEISYLTGLGFSVTGTILDTSTGTATSTTQKFIEDIANIPSTVSYFKILNAAVGSEVTYTSGKVWKSSFDTFYLPISVNPYDGDNILIDMKNSITSATGGKVIYFNGARTSASDSAVTYLTGLGFNVSGMTKIVPAKILDLPLQNNFTDYSASGISMVAANVNGLPSFVSDGSGGYAVDFGGTKSIKTAVNLPINTSDKITVVFDIKSASTAVGILMELGAAFGSGYNNFDIVNNYATIGKITIRDLASGSATNEIYTENSISNWTKLVFIVDRSLGKDQSKIYKKGIIDFTQAAGNYNNQNGNYGSYPLFIGARNGALSGGFIGQLKNLKIFNYPLSAAEIAAL